MRAFSHDNVYGPFVWLGLCGLAGGLIAVFTVPRWQTPLYKRDSEESGILAGLGSQGWDWHKPGSRFVKKSITIRTVGEGGEQHEYSSMEEVPAEIRAELETLEREAMRENSRELSVTETSERGNTVTSKIIHRKDISVYKLWTSRAWSEFTIR